MSNKLMSGLWRFMLTIPPSLWEKQVTKAGKRMEASLGFMSEEHRLVHHFVVRELPRVGKPLSPEYVAEKLDMGVDSVIVILDDLEKHMTFLVRNIEGKGIGHTL